MRRAWRASRGPHVAKDRSERRTTIESTATQLPDSFGLRRLNALIVGPPGDVDRTFNQIRPYLSSPILLWRPRETHTPPMTPCRTLVIHDVSHMDTVQQRFLEAFLGATTGRTQVVSLSEAPLFPLVQRGLFLAGLYYQLNVIYVALDGERSRLHLDK